MKNALFLGLNQYLGCFVNPNVTHDSQIIIGQYEQLIPEQCIRACQKNNYNYATIQYGNECRCIQQYDKFGQVSDDECYYSCVTSEKCGGDQNRKSIYNVLTSVTSSRTGSLLCSHRELMLKEMRHFAFV